MTRNRSLENTEPSQPATALPAIAASDEWLSTREAAEELGVTRALVHRRFAAGQIASVRLGRYYYVHRDALEAYKKANPIVNVRRKKRDTVKS